MHYFGKQSYRKYNQNNKREYSRKIKGYYNHSYSRNQRIISRNYKENHSLTGKTMSQSGTFTDMTSFSSEWLKHTTGINGTEKNGINGTNYRNKQE